MSLGDRRLNVFRDESDEDDFVSSIRARMKSRPSVVKPVIAGNDEGAAAPSPPRKVTTYVKNRTWGVDSSRRASVAAVKDRSTHSQQKALEDLDHYEAQFVTEDSEGDDKTQRTEDHAKAAGSMNGGRPKKKHKGTTSIPAIEDTMLMGQKVSQRGRQYSISRCLEVLHGMDDVSDEIKILASDVLKDAASREFFLCYESRLRGLWLKKEVAKLGAQLPPCK